MPALATTGRFWRDPARIIVVYGNNIARRPPISGTARMPAIIWAVHDGKIGMANQTLGLAEAVAPALQAIVVEKSLVLRAPWRWLPPHAWLAPLAALDPRGDR